MRESNDIITVLGVIGSDPEAKVTSGGIPLVKFRIASTQRKFDKSTNTWSDGNTNWYTVSAFRGLAQNALATLHRGDPVVVTGRLHLRAWDNGERKGISIDLEADVIGLDLQWGTANFQRTTRSVPLEQGQPSVGSLDSASAVLNSGVTGEASTELWSTPGVGRESELEATPF